MTQIYTLKGLDCANCASKIERAAAQLPSVRSAACSAVTESLNLELDDGCTYDITLEVEKIVKKYEPEVGVYIKKRGIETAVKNEHDSCGCADRNHDGIRQIIRIALGAILFVFAVFAGDYSIPLYLISYAVLGGNVIWQAVKGIFRGRILDENFLMSLATAGAIAIRNFPEACAVMLFYSVGEYFQELAIRRSRRSISELMDIRPDYANLVSEGETKRVSPSEVSIGDTILIRPGEKIPLDGVVTDGTSTIDTRALTGESLPSEASDGGTVLSGCVNLSGVIYVRVSRSFGESTAMKILDLVENAGTKKAKAEKLITAFSRIYTPAVTIMAVLLFLIPPLIFDRGWTEWLNRALIFLVISCPCALVISIPLSFFGGVGRASKIGVLVKGSNYLDALTKIDTVVFDKTGTLTKGVFKVTSIHSEDWLTESELLKAASQAEAFSNHPAARSIITAYGSEPKTEGFTNYKELAGYGVKVTVANGVTIAAGNAELMKAEGVEFCENSEAGTRVYVSIGGRYGGVIIIADEIKPDSFDAVSNLKKLGVRRTVMLTGDNAEIANEIARKLPIDEVWASLLPGQKVEMVEKLDAEKPYGGKLCFIGDGVNDAPVLARADIGVSMGGLGSDAAIEASDVVLMTDELSKLVEAVKIAGKTRRIVVQNIVFALAVKLIFLVLGGMGLSSMWEAVFADVGVSLLAVLNSLRVLKGRI